MPAGNRFKFFDVNQAFIGLGATIVASSGQPTASRAIDKNAITKWRSSGSADTTTETLSINLPQETVINRILVLDHNWKSYRIKYEFVGSPTDFTNVESIGGSLAGGITQTTYDKTTSYYEFDQVSASVIDIEIDSTQVANQEKFCSQIIITTELGTLQGYPVVRSIRNSRNIRSKDVLSGKTVVTKSLETTRFSLDFRNYPKSLTYHPDLDLMYTLHDREKNFLVWPRGGAGDDDFGYALRAFRLQDVYEMQVTSDLRSSYSNNTFILPVNLRVDFEEAI